MKYATVVCMRSHAQFQKCTSLFCNGRKLLAYNVYWIYTCLLPSVADVIKLLREWSGMGRLLALPANIKLVWKSLPGANTPAYNEHLL